MTAHDVCVVGGGPAGLGLAIEARLRGLRVVLAEQRIPPIDKACGEGVMPRGLERLAALGVLPLIRAERTHRIAGIRYINEDGSSAAALLPHGGGLGVRRLALSEALWQRAADVGVALHRGEAARWLGGEQVEIGVQPTTARVIVAADGLHSPLRRQAKLALANPASRRFGLRCHFRVEPWTDHVEISFADRIEAYVTPVGPDEIGVAFLWTPDTSRASFAVLLERFPELERRLRGKESTSRPVGLGPLAQRVSGVVAPGLALLGDAAGYVDAITGEGVSMALETSHALCDVLVAGAPLGRYARAHGRAFRRYSRLARLLLWLAERPRLRRPAVRLLGRWPRLFAALLQRLI